MNEEDIARLSPARYEHINPYGKYRFEVEEGLSRSRLRRSARLLNISHGEDRCFFLRCYRNPTGRQETCWTRAALTAAASASKPTHGLSAAFGLQSYFNRPGI